MFFIYFSLFFAIFLVMAWFNRLFSFSNLCSEHFFWTQGWSSIILEFQNSTHQDLCFKNTSVEPIKKQHRCTSYPGTHYGSTYTAIFKKICFNFMQNLENLYDFLNQIYLRSPPVREHIHRHIQKILFQFHAKSWKSWKSIWFFKSNLLKESARSASRSRTWTKRCSTIFMHRMVRINRYDGTRFF